MKKTTLKQIGLLEVGNSLQQWGSIYSDGKKVVFVPFPDENSSDIDDLPQELLVMDSLEWERFLKQSDVLDVQNERKAILRKSQRQIDSFIQWEVFARDDYKCRYCGKKMPLTVDHIDIWEDGGATVPENLIASCKKCNKIRGRTPYREWIQSEIYNKLSNGLTQVEKKKNLDVVNNLLHLVSLRVKVRSR